MIIMSDFNKNQLSVLGKVISARAKSLKLDQRSIANRTGLALNSVRSALAGKRGNIITYLTICETMQWSILDLVAEINNNPGWKSECTLTQSQPSPQGSSAGKASLAKTPS